METRDDSGTAERRERIVISVVDGQVRLQALKPGQGDPGSRQVFAGSHAQVAGFLHDRVAEAAADRRPADPAASPGPQAGTDRSA